MSNYGIKVIFKSSANGVWSKPYTYSSVIPYGKDDVVVVETGTFFSVAKVTECIPNYDFNPTKTYKNVVMKVVL